MEPVYFCPLTEVNLVITLSKYSVDQLGNGQWTHSYFDNVTTKFIINKAGVDLFIAVC